MIVRNCHRYATHTAATHIQRATPTADGRRKLLHLSVIAGAAPMSRRARAEWALQGSNLGPTDYESAALTT